MKYQKLSKATKRLFEGGQTPPIRGRVKHYTPRLRPSVSKSFTNGKEQNVKKKPYHAPVERNAPDGTDALREHGLQYSQHSKKLY